MSGGLCSAADTLLGRRSRGLRRDPGPPASITAHSRGGSGGAIERLLAACREAEEILVQAGHHDVVGGVVPGTLGQVIGPAASANLLLRFLTRGGGDRNGNEEHEKDKRKQSAASGNGAPSWRRLNRRRLAGQPEPILPLRRLAPPSSSEKHHLAYIPMPFRASNQPTDESSPTATSGKANILSYLASSPEHISDPSTSLTGQPGSAPTRTSILPKFFPSSSATSAAGAFSSPSYTSSRYFRLPSIIQGVASSRHSA
jgi:hypothetical protein